jgi:hypothetical protein
MAGGTGKCPLYQLDLVEEQRTDVVLVKPYAVCLPMKAWLASHGPAGQKTGAETNSEYTGYNSAIVLHDSAVGID